jgi:hypothetical protein
MKPIAQTFIVNEPENGVEAVFLKKIDLFFQSKSSVFGVEVQIRETTNGFPTQTTMPYGSAILSSANVATSSDASVASTFEFASPVLIRTNVQYAIAVVPIGGNEDYNIWVGQLGGNDVLTNSPITKNNQIGSLFISSNDLNFTPIQNESMKYNLYIAEFTAGGATAVFNNTNTDFFRVRNVVGNFNIGENVVVANNGLELAALTVSGSNTFAVGEIVYQPNTAPNYLSANARGVVYYANTTKILLNNVVGSFSNSGSLQGNTSGYLVTAPTTIYQNVITVANSNQIVVPDANTSYTTDFVVNNMIYIGANTRANVQVLQITGVSAGSRTLTLSGPVLFSDSNAVIGRVKANANLHGYVSTVTNTTDYKTITVRGVTSNSSENFASSQNKLLIGRDSGATANIESIFDMSYESFTPQIGIINPNKTASTLALAGTSNTRTIETNFLNLDNYVPSEFNDKQRIVMSRSNEYAFPISGGSGAGTKSVAFNVALATSNTKISPYIDKINLNAAYTKNIIVNESALSGYNINVSNLTSSFVAGEKVWQSNATVNTFATVLFSNTSLVITTDVQSNVSTSIGQLFANGSSTLTGETSGCVANIVAINTFNETFDTASPGASRYISKNVILAEGQDAEDLVSFITAYRPPGSDFKVYGRVLAGVDPDKFNQKSWSSMVETSSPALLSSVVNRDDLVELSYDFPTSVQVIANSAAVNTSSATISVSSTAAFSPGNFLYFVDSGSTGKMNVRKVVSITNSTFMTISSNPSFASSNCAVGLIPNLESQTGAFRYSNNYNITRYISDTDVAYDSFKTFAVKVVLVTDNPVSIPRMADIRCLALQV